MAVGAVLGLELADALALSVGGAVVLRRRWAWGAAGALAGGLAVALLACAAQLPSRKKRQGARAPAPSSKAKNNRSHAHSVTPVADEDTATASSRVHTTVDAEPRDVEAGNGKSSSGTSDSSGAKTMDDKKSKEKNDARRDSCWRWCGPDDDGGSAEAEDKGNATKPTSPPTVKEYIFVDFNAWCVMGDRGDRSKARTARASYRTANVLIARSPPPPPGNSPSRMSFGRVASKSCTGKWKRA